MDKVCVLMTTYNPNKWLFEQIDSIKNQKGVNADIYIRDDASTETEILNEIEKYEHVVIIRGTKNLRTSGNIKELIKYADKNLNYDYFLYSDQDDVWEENKIYTAVEQIKSLDQSKPALYCSNLMVSDQYLHPQYKLFKNGVVNCTLGQSLSQVFCFACTTAFNKPMLQEITSHDFSKIGFDSLLYYVGVLNKNIYYDNNAHILYRQHGNNVSGEKKKGLEYIAEKIVTVLGHKGESGKMKFNANYLRDNYAYLLSKEEKFIVSMVADYHSLNDRIRIINNKRIKAGYQPKDFYNVCRLIINNY